MSAPLVVNTRDGVCWTRRTVTSGGIALYAPESVKTCPRFVMATIEELAGHGIVGSAYALPLPVREEPQGERLSIARIAEIQQRAEAATPGPWEEHAAYGENFYAYLGGPCLRGVGTLNFGDGDDAEADKALTVNAREDIRALLSELFTVRAELRVARGRVAELEALKPAPVQTCRTCGAGYTYGQPCSTCEFQAQMALAQKQGGCPRNVIDGDVGGHFFKKGALSDSPVACIYCGAVKPEGGDVR